ncbi:copper amine oxidase N-terminal domain-containing protein [Paenibacillus sp. FSL P2-0136]|uniref:copper amine oxidase N-terminal domain-containing protein n=1 Tax=Paenibacillus sp. FSL P2-0136 TaxID=2975317 RepID=UPI0030DCD685
MKLFGISKSLIIGMSVIVSMALTMNTAGAEGTSSQAVSVIFDGIKSPLAAGYPYAENGITMLPFRIISGKLGTQSSWNAATKVLTLKQKENNIILTVGSSYAKVNGVPTALGAKVVQKDGMTMIPLTVVSDLLGAEVEVDDLIQSVHIHTPGKELGKLDDFGRKIRTTNLPKNYKDYPYILEDIPNEMYEMKNTINYIVKRADTGANLYAIKEVTSEGISKIIKRMNIGYDLRLNVDYKTINPASFAQEVFKYENQSVSIRENYIREYAEWVKKNRIQIEGSIDPEPSVMYYPGTGDYRIRSKFRFRINSFTEYKELMLDAYFSTTHYMNNERIKKGVWYEGYADIAVSTNYYNGDPFDHMTVGATSSLFENSIMYEVK